MIFSASDPSFKNWLNRAAVIRIRRALLVAGGDRERAARMLGIDRVQMYRRLRRDEQRVAREIEEEETRLST